MAALQPGPLLILDFDETLVDTDSSEWVATQLGAASLFDELRWVQGMPWHRAMNVVLHTLHSRGVSISHIRQALSSLPLPSQTASVLKAAHALGCELHILSDANTFFIEAVLAHHGIDALFTQIHSNPAWIDAMGRLHYDDFHGHALPPHNCPLCPPNMCKGSILKGIREAAHQPEALQVIYAGDGAGDLCPSLRLYERDCVLPRQGYPLSELLAQHQVKARVHPWTTLAVTLHDTLLEYVASSDYDLRRNPYCEPSSPASAIYVVPKGSVVSYGGCHNMRSYSVLKKTYSHWRRAFVTCQSCSPARSLYMHLAHKKHTLSLATTSRLCESASALHIFQARSSSTGQAFQTFRSLLG